MMHMEDLPYWDDIQRNSSYHTDDSVNSIEDKRKDSEWSDSTSRELSIEDLDENPLFLHGMLNRNVETVHHHVQYLEMKAKKTTASRESTAERSFFQVYNGKILDFNLFLTWVKR